MTNEQQLGSAFQRQHGFRVIDGGLRYPSTATFTLPVPYHVSCWVDELQSRLNELTGLERGWDGYDALPVSYACASFAASLMETICVDSVPAPSLVPGPDGTIQIEWHRAGFDIEVHIRGVNDVQAYRFTHENEFEETEDLVTDFSLLADWIDELDQAEQEDQLAYA